MSIVRRLLLVLEDLEAGTRAYRAYWEKSVHARDAELKDNREAKDMIHMYWGNMRDRAELDLMTKKKDLGFSVDAAMATIMSQLGALVTPSKTEEP